MFQNNPNGYSVRWKYNGKSNISKMFYGGVNFLDVYIEFFYHSLEFTITAVATDNTNHMAACAPVLLTGHFTKELFEDLGIDINNISNIAQDPERFLINIIQITSDLNYWNIKLKTFLASQSTRKKTKYKNMPLNYPQQYNGAPSNYEEKKYFYHEQLIVGDKEKIQSLTVEIEEKNNKIKDLEEELKELKEEIEMLKAINQEC